MHKYFSYFLACCSILFSCESKNMNHGSPLEEAKMISIMTDVYYLDAQFSELNSYLKDSLVFQKFIEILKTNSISLEQFKAAQLYYNMDDQAHLRLEEGIKMAVQKASIK